MPSSPMVSEVSHWHLYVILDPDHLLPDHDIDEVARAALEGGARIIQLRDKRAGVRDLITSARRLQRLCADYGATFIINDRVDVALASGADGVHLGPGDMLVSDARRIAPSLLIGASAGSVDVARELVEQGADYLGVGAIFEARASKPDASAPRGLQVVENVRAAIGADIPCVGIGGVTLENAPEVLAAGASGVAVIRAVSGQSDPQGAVQGLLARLRA